jgi:hypothetical protein
MGRRHITDSTFNHNRASLWDHILVKNSEAIDVITLCLYSEKSFTKIVISYTPMKK